MNKGKWIGSIETAKRYERKAHKEALEYSEKYTAEQVATIIWNKFGFLSKVEENTVIFNTKLGIISSYKCKA